MNLDSRVSTFAISPLRLETFFPCIAGMFLFVAGIALGKSLPNEVSFSVNANRKLTTASKLQAHGRFGTPRWLQQTPPALVADDFGTGSGAGVTVFR